MVTGHLPRLKKQCNMFTENEYRWSKAYIIMGGGGWAMLTDADMGEGGVQNSQFHADVIFSRLLKGISYKINIYFKIILFSCIYIFNFEY